MKFETRFFVKSVVRSQVSLQYDKNKVTLPAGRYTHEFFLEWEMFPTELAKKENTHLTYRDSRIQKSCRLWDNMGTYCTALQVSQMTKQRMRSACWIHKATNTHSEYVIIAFPRQQRPSMLLFYVPWLSCCMLHPMVRKVATGINS